MYDVSAVGAPLDERYPEELADAAVSALQAALPDWLPRNASPELIFIEAVSLAVADIVNAGNQTIAAVEEDILSNFYQVARRPGSAAGGQITVTFDSAVTTTIPAGTGFALTDYGIEVATVADVSVTASSTAVLDVFTTEATTLVNGVGTGAALDVLDVIPNVLSVAVTTAFAGGADPEDDTAYTATIGTDAGEVTVVTYGRGGPLSAGDKTDLAAAMQAITYAGATVHVTDAAVTTVNVTTTVVPAPGYSAGEAQTATEDAIRTFLNPETWTIGDDVIVGALQAAITDTPAVDYISAMSAPSGTVTIAANAVAKYGTITVSV